MTGENNLKPATLLVIAPQPFFQNRGTPIAVRELVLTLGRRGNLVDLLTYHEGEDVELENCTQHRIPAIPLVRNVRPGFSIKKLICDFALFWKALWLVCRKRYQVIHAVEEGVFIALFMKWVFRIPYVYDMDSSLSRQLGEKYPLPKWIRGILEYFEKVAIRNSAGVVAVCQTLEQTARTHAPDKIIATVEDKSLLDQNSDVGVPLDIEGPIVMYVGNLESYQGIDLLIAAHQELVHQVPEAQLVLIGGIPKLIQHYEQLATKLGIEHRVHFVGPRPNNQLAFYLQQADILVSPRTHGDNTPMKIYSYLDSGRPVVATRLITHTQVLDDEIAMLVDPDAESFADGLVQLIRDAELRELIAYRAKLRVDKFYGHEAFDRKINDFYVQVEETISG